MTSKQLLNKGIEWLSILNINSQSDNAIAISKIAIAYAKLAETAFLIESEPREVEIALPRITYNRPEGWMCGDCMTYEICQKKTAEYGHSWQSKPAEDESGTFGDGWNKWPEVPAPGNQFLEIMVKNAIYGEKPSYGFWDTVSARWRLYYPHQIGNYLLPQGNNIVTMWRVSASPQEAPN